MVYRSCLVEAVSCRHRELPYAGGRKEETIILEAQLGALRDIDYGIFPIHPARIRFLHMHLSSRNPERKNDHVVGVMKAYSTAWGGPFPAGRQ